MFKKQLVSDKTSSLLTKISNSLERIEKEQVRQRIDLSNLLRFLVKINNSLGLQKQVDDYFTDHDEENPPELEDK